MKFDKQSQDEERNILANLLQDDFIDYGDDEHGHNVILPMTLPKTSLGIVIWLFCKENVWQISLFVEKFPEVQPTSVKMDESDIQLSRIKLEPADESEEGMVIDEGIKSIFPFSLKYWFYA